MKIKALKVGSTNNVLTRPESVSSSYNFFVNGEKVTEKLTDTAVTFCLDDEITATKVHEQVTHYERDGEKITAREYRSKPCGYDEDSSEAEVLRAIANRREMSGFKPVSSFISELVEFDIIGNIEDTKSKFITCFIGGKYSKHAVLFTLDRNAAEVDEYLRLSETYKSHAKFEKPDRDCLEYVKINGKYSFSRSFGKKAAANFILLADAQKAESELRENVRRVVKDSVFKEKTTGFKAAQLISRLNMARVIGNVNTKDEIIDAVINDLAEYVAMLGD